MGQHDPDHSILLHAQLGYRSTGGTIHQTFLIILRRLAAHHFILKNSFQRYNWSFCLGDISYCQYCGGDGWRLLSLFHGWPEKLLEWNWRNVGQRRAEESCINLIAGLSGGMERSNCTTGAGRREDQRRKQELPPAPLNVLVHHWLDHRPTQSNLINL